MNVTFTITAFGRTFTGGISLDKPEQQPESSAQPDSYSVGATVEQGWEAPGVQAFGFEPRPR